MVIEDGPSVQIYSQSLSATYTRCVCVGVCVCVRQSEIEKDRAETRGWFIGEEIANHLAVSLTI